MSLIGECEALTKAFSGIGVDEKSIISVVGKWHPEQRQTFRKGCPKFFKEDSHLFEKWEYHHIPLLQREFLRFQKAVVQWTMHPWERDARLARKALKAAHHQHSYDVLIEIACTRSSEELLGAKRAYHSLFDHSIEEDVAYHITTINRNLLVALVSSYRYEGPKVNDEIAKSEAKIIGDAIKNAGKKVPIENDEVVRILTTRSKRHLRVIFDHYKEIYKKTIDEDLKDDMCLKQTVQCLCSPQTYFSKILDMALKGDANEHTRKALTRVIISRADANMKEIKEEFHKQYGVSLSKKIEETASGNFKDLLINLLARSD